MKEGKGIMLEDGSIDITHLMDDKDIEIWEDIFKVKVDTKIGKPAVPRFPPPLSLYSQGGSAYITLYFLLVSFIFIFIFPLSFN